MPRKTLAFAVVFCAGLLLDQGTKLWARSIPAFQEGDGYAVHERLFHLVHRENPGAAFSLLAGLPEGLRVPLFLVFNLVACWIGLSVLRSAPADAARRGAFVGLFLSGAIGNAVDRVMKGTVTDFIRWHFDYEPVYSTLVSWFGRADWPVFNVADALLFVGVIGLVWSERGETPVAPEPPRAPPP